MNIKRIKVDLELAKDILNKIYFNKYTDFDKYYYINLAAYHLQQSIEKSLKFLLNNIYDLEENAKGYKTHNITSLIDMITLYDKQFKIDNVDLYNLSIIISRWESNCLYDNECFADIDDGIKVLKISNELYLRIEVLENNIKNNINSSFFSS